MRFLLPVCHCQLYHQVVIVFAHSPHLTLSCLPTHADVFDVVNGPCVVPIFSCTLWLLQNTCSQRQVRGDLNCLVPVCHIILLFGVGLEIWMMTGLVLLLDEQCILPPIFCTHITLIRAFHCDVAGPVWSNSTADTVRFLILQGYIILSCMFRVLNVVFCAIVTLAPLTPVQHMIGIVFAPPVCCVLFSNWVLSKQGKRQHTFHLPPLELSLLLDLFRPRRHCRFPKPNMSTTLKLTTCSSFGAGLISAPNVLKI